jgi:hypothetical protein
MERRMPNSLARLCFAVTTIFCVIACSSSAVTNGQSVCLPLPRLLTMTPMGGTTGSTFDVTIAGENLDDVRELIFDHANIKATPKLNEQGTAIANTFTVTIGADVTSRLVEARVLSRLGISSARIFSIGTLPEVTRTQANTSKENAMALTVPTFCNAVLTNKAIDHYSFEAKAGTRYLIHCAARGIDSKMEPVVTISDAAGRDLLVERKGEPIDFTPQADGVVRIKLHDLTYKGGIDYFYRLSIQELATDAAVPLFPVTLPIRAFSWPPAGIPLTAATAEDETTEVQVLTLPCDVSGRFFPAADVDTFEFQAQQGETWWIEVASDRFGLNTDPSILIQLGKGEGDARQWQDILELNDIVSPVRPSSNGYAYDGPPFDGGSTDILGKFEVKETGTYRLYLNDLFGGTRKDPKNIYRLIIRKAQPDFAVAAWGLHEELRNGDRNALSKPAALRVGSTVAFEVVTVRRDGFDGAIELQVNGLPAGVTASGLTIPAGKMRSVILLSAAATATDAWSKVELTAKSKNGEQEVVRPVHVGQITWPIVDSWGEIPSPRLVDGFPVSVTSSETAPLTLSARESRVWEVKAGEKLQLPLTLTVRSEFSGAIVKWRTWGNGFEGHPAFDINLAEPAPETIIDTAALKVPAGDYTIAFHGVAVPKYRYHPQSIDMAQQEVQKAQMNVNRLTEELTKLQETLVSTAAEKKSEVEQQIQEINRQKQLADTALQSANSQLKAVTDRAAPRDTAEIVISEPITIRVLP